MVLTKRDIAKSVKTLIVMLQSLRNQQVTITLRNDTIVTGKIVDVDGQLNIELTDATVEQDLFYCIQAPNIGGETSRQHERQTTTTTASGNSAVVDETMRDEEEEEEEDQAGPSQEGATVDNLSERKDLNFDSSHQTAAGDLVDKSSQHQQTPISADNETAAIVATDPLTAAAADQQLADRRTRKQKVDTSGTFRASKGDDLSNATTITVYDYFIVKGSRVRHIDLPTDCDMIASTKREIERIRGRRKQWTKRDIVQQQQQQEQQHQNQH